MLKPERMYKVGIVTLKKDLKRTMHSLQDLGIIEIKKTKKELEKINTPEKITQLRTDLNRIKRIRKVLDKKNNTIEFSISKPLQKITLKEYSDNAFIFASKSRINNIFKETSAIEKEEREIQNNLTANTRNSKELSYFSDLNPTIRDNESGFIDYSIAKTRIENIKKIKTLADIQIAHEDSDMVYFQYICKKNNSEELTRLITPLKTSNMKGKIKAILRNIEKEDRLFHIRLIELKKEKNNLIKHLPQLIAIEERLKNIYERYDNLGKLNSTQSTAIIEGWVPKDSIRKLEEIDWILTVKHLEKNNAPTKMTSIPLIKDFNILTKWFGVPNYSEYDPTILIAIAFPLFFAIMLGDAGYALALLTASAYVYYKTNSSTIKSISAILLISSVIATIVGMLFGSVFGNILGFESYLNILKQPVELIKISLIIGIIHLNIGVFLGISKAIHHKDKEPLMDRLSFIALEIGTILLITMFSHNTMKWIGLGLIVSAFAIQSRKGIIGFLEIPSTFGSWVSYIRLMALCIATSWLMFVINLAAGMAAASSIILASIIFVFGNLFLAPLNILSAFIHSMRLHYVEFFKNFYDGSGKEFKPLKNRKKYHKEAYR